MSRAVEDVVYPLVPGAGSRETVTRTFDGLGHPYDLAGGQSYVEAASWTAAGQPGIWEFGTGDITRRWDYDPATLRVTQLKAGTSQISGTATVNLMRLEYWYDDSGDVTRILDYRNSSQYECYDYDIHNRLTDAFTGNSTCSSYASTGYAPFDHDYGYDNLHNLTSLDGPTYSYGSGNEAGSGDAGPHAVVAIGSNLAFGYDDNGNRVSKTDNSVATTYDYGPENRLTGVDLPNDADDVTFVYDADGRRVSRTHGDHSTTYVAAVMEIDRDGQTVTETRSFYSFAGTPVAVRTHEDAATTFLFQNHLGSTVAAFDDTANTAIKQYYYPYGSERHAVGSLPVDQRYTGQTSDATGADSGSTGLLYYQARYYDPDAGAFVAADTIVPTTGLSAGLNRYAYVAGNPANATDPSGHTQCEERGLCRESPRGIGASPRSYLGLGWILSGLSQGIEELEHSSVTIVRHSVHEQPLWLVTGNLRGMYEQSVLMSQWEETVTSHSLLGRKVSPRTVGLVRSGAKALVYLELGFAGLDTLRALADVGPTAALEVAANRTMDAGFAAGFGAVGAQVGGALTPICPVCPVLVPIGFAVFGNWLSDKIQAMTGGQGPSKIIGRLATP